MVNRCRMLTRKRKSRRIGEGAFGYVVKPAIPCVGRNVSRKVSKLFKKQANIHKNFQSNYKNFATRRAQLTPVIEKLRELDPEQKHFLYPEFCDTPGELTDELRTNGVTNESKHESYLMTNGGISYKQLLEPFVELVNAALRQDGKKDFTSGERRKDIAEKFLAVMYPLVKQAEDLLNKLFDAHILHGDLHHGNILLLTDHASMSAFSKIISVVQDVKKSPSYLDFDRPFGGTDQFLKIYPMTREQVETTYALVDEFAAAKSFTSVIIQIIDWDSATIIDDLTEDEQSDIRHDYLHMFFPQSHDVRFNILDMYYKYCRVPNITTP